MENIKMIEQKKEQEKVSKKASASRRNFLKKTVYATPTLITLGTLSKPVSAFASVVDTRNGPGGGFGGGFGGG